MLKRFALCVTFFAICALGVCHSNAYGQLVGLTSNNTLITFSPSTPGTTSLPLPVTGLNVGDALRGIDFRPATGALYGFAQNGTTGNLYTINSTTGIATFASTLSTTLNGTLFGVDFNPVPDRLRVVSDADQNLRINVDTGATTVDTALAFAAADANFGANPNAIAAAYTNSRPGLIASTQLFVLDSSLGILALQNPPNNGTLNTIGSLGATVGANTPFDINGETGIAYAVLGGNVLSQVNLATGASTFLGNIGGGAPVIGLSSQISAIPEPTSYLLLGIASLTLARSRVRRTS